MATLDFATLLADMTGAAAAVASHRWPQMRDSVMPQFEALASTAVQIERDKLLGLLDEDDARTLAEMQKNALIAVTAGMKGQLKLAAEEAINAALGVARTALNGAVGMPLL